MRSVFLLPRASDLTAWPFSHGAISLAIMHLIWEVLTWDMVIGDKNVSNKFSMLTLFFFLILALIASFFLHIFPRLAAVRKALPNIDSYLREVLRKEKLTPEAEALRARYEVMLGSLEKATTTVRHSIAVDPVGLASRQRGK